jgi:2-phosphosulfolactate phosphatase
MGDSAMSRPILVHLLPTLLEPIDLHGGVAVVIDVLRATSTIVQALAAGATSVVPCGEIDEARSLAARAAPGTVVLGGERKGVTIPGFDLGNSPDDYTHKVVGGKQLIFTTTNGTRALLCAKEARRVLTGAISNLSAVVELLSEEQGPVHLICAGTDGRVTLEDVLCAGGIVRWLAISEREIDPSDDATQLAMNLFDSCGRDYDRLFETLRKSRGGRNLIECGLEADIVKCAEQDQFDIVPELDREVWEIRPACRTEANMKHA